MFLIFPPKKKFHHSFLDNAPNYPKEMPQLTYISLLGIMFTYASFIPFGLSPTGLICLMRMMVLRLAFVFIFSAMLSRSLMLATADTDGLPGHLSGLIQSSLFCFMLGVKVSTVLYVSLLDNASNFLIW